jgi:hypothetical protein
MAGLNDSLTVADKKGKNARCAGASNATFCYAEHSQASYSGTDASILP